MSAPLTSPAAPTSTQNGPNMATSAPPITQTIPRARLTHSQTYHLRAMHPLIAAHHPQPPTHLPHARETRRH
ncbi:hypothetical protein CHS0354_010470, partial [Potamilus streckersoni]